MSSIRKGNIILSLIGSVGIILILWALIKQSGSAESFDYAVTKGVVTTYSIDPYFDNDTEEGTELKNRYTIQYKYSVAYQEYYSNTISYDKKIELANVRNYSLGMEVDVYYDTQGPSNAVLIPGEYQLNTSYLFVVGIVLIGISIVGLFFNIKHKGDTSSNIPSEKTSF